MKLLTKKEIAESWGDLDDPMNNKPCCPYCLDNLSEYTDKEHGLLLYCNNEKCDSNVVYDKDGDMLIGNTESLIPDWVRNP
jgi:hypothetical protein